MIDPGLLLAFLPAVVLLMLLPGPDMLLCLAQGLRGGPRRGVAAAAGVSTGVLVNVTLAGLGLGALVAAFPDAIRVVRWAGAAYLLWVAWRTWTTPLVVAIGGAAPGRWIAYRDGLVVNLTNPKVILFVLALLPQYVNPALPVLPQFVTMGAIMALGALIVNGAVGWSAGRAAGLLLRSTRTERTLRRLAAALFAGLALRIVWEAAAAD